MDEINGITSKLIGEDKIAITFHHYVVGNIDVLTKDEDESKKLIGEFVKKVKDKFKDCTKKALTMKKVLTFEKPLVMEKAMEKAMTMEKVMAMEHVGQAPMRAIAMQLIQQ
jgi:hypothetical protein